MTTLPAEPVVRLTRLTKTFGTARGIRDVDLEVTAGQVFAFLGPNGAGKSTTIRLMMGLYRPTSGLAELFGLDVATHGPRTRRRVGYLPGELSLCSRLTGRETLDRFARMRGDVDDGFRRRLERRFDTPLDRPVHQLSKGNRQKVALVRAFMSDPELLVLDEPTSGLDPLLQREFAVLLQESVDRGRTVFLSSHDLDEVQRLASTVAIVREGEIVACDTVAGLRSRAPRLVEITLRDHADRGRFDRVPGVVAVSVEGRSIRVRAVGELGPLFEACLPFGIVDVAARPADLDELFLDFYTAEAGATDGGRDLEVTRVP